MLECLGYENKRVIVSGCFSGIGRATARILWSLGAEVHAIDCREVDHDRASFHKVDLREPELFHHAVSEIGGKIDALFNCAGLTHAAGGLDAIKVNYLGTRRLTESVIPRMDANGAIVSVAAACGIGWGHRFSLLKALISTESDDEVIRQCKAHALNAKDAYVLSKELLVAWTMLTSQQIITRGIRINCTMPGLTQTPMMDYLNVATPPSLLNTATQPLRRLSSAQEQAAALVFLNSDVAGSINGTALPIDGGLSTGITLGNIKMKKMVGASLL